MDYCAGVLLVMVVVWCALAGDDWRAFLAGRVFLARGRY